MKTTNFSIQGLLLAESKQSNKRFLFKSGKAVLFLSLFTVLSITFGGNALAQSLSGGTGHNGYSGSNNATSGGANSVSGVGDNGANGWQADGYGNGGGGGGAGISGGAGGLGGAFGGAGGAGGTLGGGNGNDGTTVNSKAGGGGGGGGGAALNVLTTSANSSSLIGGKGGNGGSSINNNDSAGGGGGGAGGYGAIVNTSGVTLTNTSSIAGGMGGDGGGGYYGGGKGGSGGVGVYLGNSSNLDNSGVITGGNGGAGGVASSGSGTGLAGSAASGVYVDTASISTITNMGTITGGIGSFGIWNDGTISTLNNSQATLTYNAILPTNYNIIINSTTDFGKIAFSSPSGTTTFGISSHSGTNIGVTGTRYQNVISGLAASYITNEDTVLNYQNGNLSATYKLVENSGAAWDLLILSMINGPSATDTQASIYALAPKLRGAFSSQAIATNFANMNTYDCDLFNAKGVCVSVGGQQTYVDNPSSNMTSTVVVAGYKVSPKIRIGGFLNQNINNNTVSGVHISNANPLMGVFAVWNQKEDRLGYQVKIANAYQDKDVTTTRDVVGTSQAGTGSTTLNTQSYVGELSYAFLANQEKTLVRPYTALRYTSIKQDGYTEQTSAGVTAPLTYAALADRSTTALLGVKLNHKLAEKVNLTGSFGIEQDLHHQVDNLTATGVAGLTSENFNNSIKRTRPVASIGAYYMPVKNQRISADIYYQQMPFQSTGSATAYVNYTIGF